MVKLNVQKMVECFNHRYVSTYLNYKVLVTKRLVSPQKSLNRMSDKIMKNMYYYYVNNIKTFISTLKKKKDDDQDIDNNIL